MPNHGSIGVSQALCQKYQLLISFVLLPGHIRIEVGALNTGEGPNAVST